MDLEAQGERKGVTIEPDADWQTVITPRVSSPRAASQDGGRDAAASDGAPSSRARCDACDHCADVCSDPDCFKCSAKDAASSTQYTMCQVRRHCTEESCWLVAHGNVYDVTSMVKRHPGGQRSIMRHAGQESTEDFDFHSKSGKKLWGPLRIGGVIRCPSEPAKDTCLIS